VFPEQIGCGNDEILPGDVAHSVAESAQQNVFLLLGEHLFCGTRYTAQACAYMMDISR
jgi:hypothetical protein